MRSASESAEADTSRLVTLLSKDFLVPVGIPIILAAPLAYYSMQRWLEDFAYRIEMGPGLFLLAGGLALGVALATYFGMSRWLESFAYRIDIGPGVFLWSGAPSCLWRTLPSAIRRSGRRYPTPSRVFATNSRNACPVQQARMDKLYNLK